MYDEIYGPNEWSKLGPNRRSLWLRQARAAIAAVAQFELALANGFIELALANGFTSVTDAITQARMALERDAIDARDPPAHHPV